MVDLELYRIFNVVANEENITKASKILNISQPAVTKHIQNLEKLLRVKLFERTNKGLKLTDEGKKINEEIKEPLNILENIYFEYSETKSINLGIHSTMLNKLFSKKLSDFYCKFEDIKVNITNNNTLDMISKLEKGELDIVVSKKTIEYNSEKIEFISLGKLNDILAISNSNDIGLKPVTIKELKEQVIYMPRKTSITSYNFLKSINCNLEEFKNVKNISYNTMIEIIKNGNSIGLMTKEYIKEELAQGEIKELQIEFRIQPIEYGIYLNKEIKFKELKYLTEILRGI